MLQFLLRTFTPNSHPLSKTCQSHSSCNCPSKRSRPQHRHKHTDIITALQQDCSAKLRASSQLSSKVAQQNPLLQTHARTARLTALCQPLPCVLLLHFSVLILLLGCLGEFSPSVGVARALEKSSGMLSSLKGATVPTAHLHSKLAPTQQNMPEPFLLQLP